MAQYASRKVILSHHNHICHIQPQTVQYAIGLVELRGLISGGDKYHISCMLNLLTRLAMFLGAEICLAKTVLGK